MDIPSVCKSTCDRHVTEFGSPGPLLKLGVAVCTPVTPALLGEEGGGSLGLAVCYMKSNSRFSESTWLQGTRQRVTERDTQCPLSVLLMHLGTISPYTRVHIPHIDIHIGTQTDRHRVACIHRYPLAALLHYSWPCSLAVSSG